MNETQLLQSALNSANLKLAGYKKRAQERINQFTAEVKELEKQMKDLVERNEVKVGDIYVYNGVCSKMELMVAQVGASTLPLYCLICLNGPDKGKRWDEPDKDINQVWGLQKAKEFTKVEE